MSTMIMSQCWPIQGLSATQKAVLISLADNANDEGVCWPSIASISERTCLSERAVRSSLRKLEDLGLLVSHQRSGRSTWYTVAPDGFNPGTSCPPEPDAPRHDVPPTPASDAGHPGTTCPQNRKGTVKEPPFSAQPGKTPGSVKLGFGLTDLLADNPHGASEQVLADWLTCRKRMRAAVTSTVWDRVNTELGLCVEAGISADDALAEAQEAGWRGFKCEWVLNRMERASPDSNAPPSRARASSGKQELDHEDTSWVTDGEEV